MLLCQFGCGLEAKYTFSSGTISCSPHVNQCPKRRENISKSKKGIIPWCKGQTKETNPILAAIAEKAKGRERWLEYRQNISKSKKGSIPWNKGLTAKDDDRIASGIRNARWGKSLSLNARKHLSEYNKKHSGFIGNRNPWFGKKRNGPLSPRWNPFRHNREFKNFQGKVYILTEKTYYQYKNRINPNNYIRGKAGVENGWHLDHRISVAWGYKNGWTPEMLSAKENLQMLPWRENVLKSSKCDWDGYFNPSINIR